MSEEKKIDNQELNAENLSVEDMSIEDLDEVNGGSPMMILRGKKCPNCRRGFLSATVGNAVCSTCGYYESGGKKGYGQKREWVNRVNQFLEKIGLH